jgi:hypothetical protein
MTIVAMPLGTLANRLLRSQPMTPTPMTGGASSAGGVVAGGRLT